MELPAQTLEWKIAAYLAKADKGIDDLNAAPGLVRGAFIEVAKQIIRIVEEHHA